MCSASDSLLEAFVSLYPRPLAAAELRAGSLGVEYEDEEHAEGGDVFVLLAVSR